MVTATRLEPARPTASEPAAPRWGFAEWFILSQTALPALLFLPGTQPIRLPIRVASYAISLVGLVEWAQSKRRRSVPAHPAVSWLLGAVFCLVLMLLHPNTNSVTGGLAQVMLYLSVLAPVIWAPPLVRGRQHLVRLLALLLVCNGVNSVVGILQVYDPGTWMPREFSSVVTNAEFSLDAVAYTGRHGERVIRPPGLFDNPGAVCGPAMLAVFVGLAFCLGPTAPWKKAISLGLAGAGMAAIYLSHVRSSLIVVTGMVLICGVVLGVFLKERLRAGLLVGLYSLLAAAGLSFAVTLGGKSVGDRFGSLLDDDPAQLYHRSRGAQVEYGLTQLLWENPLGAGLGRWGMMYHYFGDHANADSPPLWVEVQPNAWIVDGGLILLCLYGGALVATTLAGLALARRAATPEARFWAAVVFAVNTGTLALVFSYTPFSSQIGLQFWFLAGAVFGAARQGLARHGQPVAPSVRGAAA